MPDELELPKKLLPRPAASPSPPDPGHEHTRAWVKVAISTLTAVVSLGGVGIGLKALQAEAQDAARTEARLVADAGVRAQEQRISLLERTSLAQADDTREVKQSVREVKQSVNDVSLKLDLMLYRFSVPNPAPSDGGR